MAILDSAQLASVDGRQGPVRTSQSADHIVDFDRGVEGHDGLECELPVAFSIGIEKDDSRDLDERVGSFDSVVDSCRDEKEEETCLGKSFAGLASEEDLHPRSQGIGGQKNSAVKVMVRVRPRLNDDQDGDPCLRILSRTQLEVLVEPRALLTERSQRRTNSNSVDPTLAKAASLQTAQIATLASVGTAAANCIVSPNLGDLVSICPSPARCASLGSTAGIDASVPFAVANGFEPRVFGFDNVFADVDGDDTVFNEVQNELAAAVAGESVCILAYGATGSGKTHTVTNLAERAAKELERQADALEAAGQRLEMTVQIVEIYNEQFRDLLATESHHEPPRLKLSMSSNIPMLQGASFRMISSMTVNGIANSLRETLRVGQSQRATSSTAVHGRSSRSHLVMSLFLHTRDVSTGTYLRTGKLSLVDLAGSERIKNSEATGERLREAQYINRSLSALGDVIWARERRVAHVPYRNSKLTQLLQDSLGGQPLSRTVVIITVPPTKSSMNETLHSLQFSSRLISVSVQTASRRSLLHREPSRSRAGYDDLRSEAERLREENNILRAKLEGNVEIDQGVELLRTEAERLRTENVQIRAELEKRDRLLRERELKVAELDRLLMEQRYSFDKSSGSGAGSTRSLARTWSEPPRRRHNTLPVRYVAGVAVRQVVDSGTASDRLEATASQELAAGSQEMLSARQAPIKQPRQLPGGVGQSTCDAGPGSSPLPSPATKAAAPPVGARREDMEAALPTPRRRMAAAAQEPPSLPGGSATVSAPSGTALRRALVGAPPPRSNTTDQQRRLLPERRPSAPSSNGRGVDGCVVEKGSTTTGKRPTQCAPAPSRSSSAAQASGRRHPKGGSAVPGPSSPSISRSSSISQGWKEGRPRACTADHRGCKAASREYTVEVISPQKARELTQGGSATLPPLPDSPRLTVQRRDSPALLLCPEELKVGFYEGLCSSMPRVRSSSSISLSSDEGDIKNRLRQTLQIERISLAGSAQIQAPQSEVQQLESEWTQQHDSPPGQLPESQSPRPQQEDLATTMSIKPSKVEDLKTNLGLLDNALTELEVASQRSARPSVSIVAANLAASSGQPSTGSQLATPPLESLWVTSALTAAVGGQMLSSPPTVGKRAAGVGVGSPRLTASPGPAVSSAAVATPVPGAASAAAGMTAAAMTAAAVAAQGGGGRGAGSNEVFVAAPWPSSRTVAGSHVGGGSIAAPPPVSACQSGPVLSLLRGRAAGPFASRGNSPHSSSPPRVGVAPGAITTGRSSSTSTRPTVTPAQVVSRALQQQQYASPLPSRPTPVGAPIGPRVGGIW